MRPHLTKSLQPWLSPSTMLASSFLALTMMTGTTASGTVLRSSVQNSCPARTRSVQQKLMGEARGDARNFSLYALQVVSCGSGQGTLLAH